ncbi:MAG: Spx/MgsR family RNA polymerase-binding regulatory protein [Gammaproteobacteria bacterium]
MTIKLYGIKNCDSCKKALKYLTAQDVDAELIDVREQPPTTKQLKEWCQEFGRDAFVNKRSTTWRGLSDTQKAITSDAQALALIKESPTLMKRPVIVAGETLLLGFKAGDLDQLIN